MVVAHSGHLYVYFIYSLYLESGKDITYRNVWIGWFYNDLI